MQEDLDLTSDMFLATTGKENTPFNGYNQRMTYIIGSGIITIFL